LVLLTKPALKGVGLNKKMIIYIFKSIITALSSLLKIADINRT
jgi:hypothetical protein